MTRCLLLTLLLLATACGGDDAAMEAPDGGTLADAPGDAPVGEAEIVEGGEASAPRLPDMIALAEADGRFTVLLQALDASGLAEDLAGGDYTLFAPTDDAFAALGDEAQATLLDPRNRGALRTLLRYHLVSGERTSGMIGGGTDLRTLTGRTLLVEDSAGRLVVGDGAAVVTEADQRAANGVIHVIDAVLLPPDDLL